MAATVSNVITHGARAARGRSWCAFMYFTIVTGRPGTPMGSFATSLSPDEIWQVITFLREESQRVKAAAAKNKGDEEPW